ncbi:hypothetical protein [Lichenicoccus roseus]|uniref:hypothetical protein n=1 Tax=Lichenicoccus roseus TaxID=2683649 RepID=UPI001487255D|nr:hypothetical protein [Lichenicoccus roseus]
MQIASIASPPVRAASSPAAPAVAEAAPAIATAPRVLNPDLHLDPSLGIVVTEYFNQHGDETQQFPTHKAIERYQMFGMTKTSAGSAS